MGLEAEKLELLRTLLLVPGNRPAMIEKARSLPADVLVLDLEDGVPLAEKSIARDTVRKSLPGLALKAQKVFVRINSLASGMAEEDIDAIVALGLDGISPPKMECSEDIVRLDRALEDREKSRGLSPGSIHLIPWTETARGIINAFDIARASPRVMGIAFGADDYALDMRIVRSEEGTELFYPRSVMAISSVAAGVAALDTPYVNFRGEAGLLRDAQLARQLGFRGKFVIHPSQIEPVNRVFSPSSSEVAFARKVIAAFEAAVSQGAAVTPVEGKMIDTPVAERARRLLVLAEAIAQKESER